MASFIGCYQHALDDKNRLMIPHRLRDRLEEEREGVGFYITRGLEKCLALFTPNEWEKMERELDVSREEFRNTDTRKFMRQFYGNAEYVAMDKQGRILLTERLKELGELKRDVVLVGVRTRVEIWDAQRWDEFMKESADQYEDFASKALPGL
jgi:MraZ protein